MNRIFFVLVLLVALTSCGSGTDNNSSKIGPESNAGVETLSGAAAEPTATVADTPKFFLESDTLIGGYQFGMNISDWNKLCASKARSDPSIDIVENGNCIEVVVPIVTGAASATDVKTQYRIRKSGIFSSGHLIGIKREFYIPEYLIEEFCRAICEQDTLKYLAGSKIENLPPYGSNSEITHMTSKEFDEVFEESDAEKKGEKKFWGKHTHNQTSTTDYKSLFESSNSYVVFQLRCTESTNSICDNNHDAISQLNHISYSDFVIREYSKYQAGINIEDYYTESQKEKILREKKKQELIEKALKAD